MLIVTNQDRTAFAQPAERSFDNPAASRISFAAAIVPFLFPNLAYMGYGSTTRRGRATRGIAIPLVQTQVLGPARSRLGTRHHDRLKRTLQQLGIMHIRRVDHRPERTAVTLDHQAAFHPVFPAIRGVGADPIPPKRALAKAPSADCHSQSTPPNCSQARVSFFQTL